jgi:hypothetical protein
MGRNTSSDIGPKVDIPVNQQTQNRPRFKQKNLSNSTKALRLLLIRLVIIINGYHKGSSKQREVLGK